jgi:hypothetical protein
MAEGVVELIYKHVAETHKRVVDDVVVSVKAPPQEALVVDASELSGENREAVAALVRQDTNRTAFRRSYKERVDAYKASAQELQQRVEAYMVEAGKQELVIGLRGQDDLQIKIKRSSMSTAAAAAAPAAVQEETRPVPPTQKQLLCEAVETTLRTLRVDPRQRYDPVSAVQFLAHPQARPLINRAMHEAENAAHAGTAAPTTRKRTTAPTLSAVVRVKRG